MKNLKITCQKHENQIFKKHEQTLKHTKWPALNEINTMRFFSRNPALSVFYQFFFPNSAEVLIYKVLQNSDSRDTEIKFKIQIQEIKQILR